MYSWLRAELSAVDRASTPWLVVQMHAGFYSTALVHSYEAECMRQAYEPLFREFGVDLVLSGHDHMMERSAPTYNYQVDPECGTVSEKRDRKIERDREKRERKERAKEERKTKKLRTETNHPTHKKRSTSPSPTTGTRSTTPGSTSTRSTTPTRPSSPTTRPLGPARPRRARRRRCCRRAAATRTLHRPTRSSRQGSGAAGARA